MRHTQQLSSESLIRIDQLSKKLSLLVAFCMNPLAAILRVHAHSSFDIGLIAGAWAILAVTLILHVPDFYFFTSEVGVRLS
jgi:hypothetical protein